MLKSPSLCLYSSNLDTFWLKISSNGQNCSILSQKVPKFELYKHNDEPFNIYYGIFYELWNFVDFDRLCKLEKRGDEIKKIFSSETIEPITFWLKIEQFWPFEEISIFSNGGHLGYRTALTDTILKGDHLRIISAKFGWDWANLNQTLLKWSLGGPLSKLCPSAPSCIQDGHNY
jgi:hypothetical protein